MLRSQRLPWFWLLGAAAVTLLALGFTMPAAASTPPTPEPQPMTTDRLAIPVLPENPTQVQLGDSVYYYNCMPCHGDQGQGLTDEFREIWIEDHQNCWASGCHGGRERDEGFPLPKFIPGILNLDHFSDVNSLFAYLQTTHPPQRPGALTETEYWAATAFVLYKNNRITADGAVGPEAKVGPLSGNKGLLVFLITVPLVALLLIRQTRSGQAEDTHAIL